MSTASHIVATAVSSVAGTAANAAASRSETDIFGRAAAAMSVDLDLAGARHRGPVHDLVRDVLAELRRRHRHRRQRLLDERVAQFLGGEDLVDLRVQLARDGLRRARGPDDAVPRESVEALVAG